MGWMAKATHRHGFLVDIDIATPVGHDQAFATGRCEDVGTNCCFGSTFTSTSYFY